MNTLVPVTQSYLVFIGPTLTCAEDVNLSRRTPATLNNDAQTSECTSAEFKGFKRRAEIHLFQVASAWNATWKMQSRPRQKRETPHFWPHSQAVTALQSPRPTPNTKPYSSGLSTCSLHGSATTSARHVRHVRVTRLCFALKPREIGRCRGSDRFATRTVQRLLVRQL